jgi:hypothetical protein
VVTVRADDANIARGPVFRDVREREPNDDRLRGMGRWAVRFRGPLGPEAVAALKEAGVAKSQLAHFFDTPGPEPNTTVVVQASSEDDAIARVRSALERHGEFSSFEAVPFVEPA